MKYFTNREVTEIYAVSYDAVRKWIQSAQDGKVDLQIGQSDSGKWQIANTSKNIEVIEQLVARGKKHKNSRAYKVVQPRPEFYELYSPSQQLDIISSIESYREIPLQYSYFDGGAAHWDKYSQKLLDEQNANILKDTIELIDANKANIDRLIARHKRVNVIDLGVGNGAPVKGLLEYLREQGVLGKYVGIDISPDMLEVAKKHIFGWFGSTVTIEMHVRDISTESFKDILIDDYLESDEKSLNLVLLLGGTMNNFRQPDNVFRLINASMLPEDVLLYTSKLDTPNSRQFFDFNASGKQAALSDKHKLVIELLGITPDMYEVEQYYDSIARSRFIRIRLKIATSLDVKTPGISCLDLNKNEAISLWHFWHTSAFETNEQFDRNGFDLLNTSVTRDREYMLAMASVTTSTK